MAKGRKTGGRKAGSLNKLTKVRESLTGGEGHLGRVQARINQIIDNVFPCTVCRGTGKTRFQPLNGAHPGVRECQSCWGSGLEELDPDLIAKVLMEEKKYLLPQRKAIEISGSLDVNIAQIIRERRMRLAGANGS